MTGSDSADAVAGPPSRDDRRDEFRDLHRQLSRFRVTTSTTPPSHLKSTTQLPVRT